MTSIFRFVLHLVALAGCLIGLASAQTVVSPPIAQVFAGGTVHALAAQPDGKVIVGGQFTHVRGVPRHNLARLNADGSVDAGWTVNGVDSVNALAIDASGNVFVGGFISQGGMVWKLARISGADGALDTAWNPGIDGTVRAIAIDAAGSVYAGGEFQQAGGQVHANLVKVSATDPSGAPDPSWSASTGTNGIVRALALDPAGNLLIGGDFVAVNGVSRQNLARLFPDSRLDTSWSPSAQNAIAALAIDSAGDVYAAGLDARKYSGVGGAVISTWAPNPAREGTLFPRVNALLLDGAGGIYMAGAFTAAGGQSRLNIAKVSALDGAADPQWNPGLQAAQVSSLAMKSDASVLAGGDIVRAGTEARGGIARFTGPTAILDRTWPMVLKPGVVNAIARDPAGRTVIGGYFVALGDGSTARSNIARFAADGDLDAGWNPDAESIVVALQADASSNVYAGGYLTRIGGLDRRYVAKLNATDGAADAGWNASPTAVVRAIGVDAAGEIFIGGDFNGVSGYARSYVAKLAPATGDVDVSWNPGATGPVLALATDNHGGVYFSSNRRVGRVSASGAGDADPGWNSYLDVDTAQALAVDANGMVYVAGWLATRPMGTKTTFLRRLSATGSLDTTWDPRPLDEALALAVGSAGKLYAGGQFGIIGGQTRLNLARLDPAGAADPAWIAHAGGIVRALAWDAAADVVYAGGSFTNVAGTPRFGFAAIQSAPAAMVSHFYQAILGRSPDAAGLAFWNAEAERVRSLGASINEAFFAMAMSFFGSAEYAAQQTTNAEFMADLYNTFFNRAADSAGLAYWTGLLDQGMPREVLLASFMFSTEFADYTRARFGDNAVRPEVDMVMDFYRGMLSRLPDSAGFSYWLQRFRSAQCQGSAAVYAEVEAVSAGFLGSTEYVNRARTNAQFVGDLYNAFLRRGGDLDGVKYWIAQLDSGASSRDTVRQAFKNSPEFNTRVNRVVSQTCLSS